MADERRDGDFRVLWLGDSDVLPVAARTSGDAHYGLSRDGAGDVRDSFAVPAGDGEPVLEDALALLGERQTARFGHLVAPTGVRYVAVVRRQAPGGGETRPYDESMRTALSEQLDLAVVQSEDDMMLYENQAWAPTRSVVPAEVDVDAEGESALDSAMRAGLRGAAAVHGPFSESEVPAPGTFLFGDAYDTQWRADGDDGALPHRRAFGWSNAFEADRAGRVDLHFDGGPGRMLLLLLETLLWVGAIVLWVRARRGAPAEPEAA
jgi:hypothetical protein